MRLIHLIQLNHSLERAEVQHQSGTPGRIGISRFDALGVEHAMAIKNQIKQRRHAGEMQCPHSGEIMLKTHPPTEGF